jgi:hypothetical protein
MILGFRKLLALVPSIDEILLSLQVRESQTCRDLEVGFLEETRLLGVRFIYAHLL